MPTRYCPYLLLFIIGVFVHENVFGLSKFYICSFAFETQFRTSSLGFLYCVVAEYINKLCVSLEYINKVCVLLDLVCDLGAY